MSGALNLLFEVFFKVANGGSSLLEPASCLILSRIEKRRSVGCATCRIRTSPFTLSRTSWSMPRRPLCSSNVVIILARPSFIGFILAGRLHTQALA